MRAQLHEPHGGDQLAQRSRHRHGRNDEGDEARERGTGARIILTDAVGRISFSERRLKRANLVVVVDCHLDFYYSNPAAVST